MLIVPMKIPKFVNANLTISIVEGNAIICDDFFPINLNKVTRFK